MTAPNQTKNRFERWYAGTIPHMDFGSHKAMFQFAYDAGWCDRSLGDEQIIDELLERIKRLEANQAPSSLSEALNSGDGTYRP